MPSGRFGKNKNEDFALSFCPHGSLLFLVLVAGNGSQSKRLSDTPGSR